MSEQVPVLRANRDISSTRCHVKLQERQVWSILKSVKHNVKVVTNQIVSGYYLLWDVSVYL